MLSENLDTPRPTVLVIDNDASSRKLMGLILQREGFQPVLADSARQALALVESLAEPASLVISDIFLGDTNGMDIVAQLRPRWPDASVLFTSGFTEATLQDRGWRLDAPFIEKPICIKRLRGVLALHRAKLDLVAALH